MPAKFLSNIKYHFLYIFPLLLLTAGIYFCIAVYFKPLGLGHDAVHYMATGRYMVEHSTFQPHALPYKRFLETGPPGHYDNGFIDYPNFGFSFAIGLIGKMRGEYSLLNSVYLAAFFFFIFIVTIYCFIYALVQNRAQAFLFSLSMPFIWPIYIIIAMPLADPVLLSFFMLAALSALQGHFFISGIILSVGYVFKEHALLFIPFLPLLNSEIKTIKKYIYTIIKIIVAFLPVFISYNLVHNIFFHQQTIYGSGFYIRYITGIFHKFFSVDSIIFFFKDILFIARNAWPVFAFFIFCAFFLRKHVNILSSRLIGTGIGIVLITCFLFAHLLVTIPVRYIIYSFPLFWAAIALIICTIKKHTLLISISVIVSIILFINLSIKYRSIDAFSMRNIINLSSRYADAMDNIRKPVQLRKIIPSNSIVLFMHTLPDFLQDPIRISPNEYALFASSKGNERFAAIILYYPHRNKENESWYIHGDVITDDYGVRFERLKGLQLKDYLVYIREDLATK